jgi:hypothetical protein
MPCASFGAVSEIRSIIQAARFLQSAGALT